MCVENYENIKDLKAVIVSVFHEVSDRMVTQPWRTSVDDWKWSFGIRGHILKNKVEICLCVVYIKILMLSEHFEPKLMEIGRIELQLFKF